MKQVGSLPWTRAQESTPDPYLDVSKGSGDLCAQAESITEAVDLDFSCLSQSSMQLHRKENELMNTLSL